MTTSLHQQCTHCQATLRSSAKFCDSCGTAVAATLPKEEQLQFARVREQSQGAYSILVPNEQVATYRELMRLQKQREPMM